MIKILLFKLNNIIIFRKKMILSFLCCCVYNRIFRLMFVFINYSIINILLYLFYFFLFVK